jgi:hypothetical protein
VRLLLLLHARLGMFSFPERERAGEKGGKGGGWGGDRREGGGEGEREEGEQVYG